MEKQWQIFAEKNIGVQLFTELTKIHLLIIVLFLKQHELDQDVSPWPGSAELWPDTAAVSVPQRRIFLSPQPQHSDHLSHWHTRREGIRNVIWIWHHHHVSYLLIRHFEALWMKLGVKHITYLTGCYTKSAAETPFGSCYKCLNVYCSQDCVRHYPLSGVKGRYRSCSDL